MSERDKDKTKKKKGWCIRGRGGKGGGGDLPAWLVPQAATPGLILAAAKDVADESFPAEERLRRRRGQLVCLRRSRRSLAAGVDQRPAAANPVAVATVDELVRTPREATLGGILTRRKPRDEPWNVEVSTCNTRSSCQYAWGVPYLPPRRRSVGLAAAAGQGGLQKGRPTWRWSGLVDQGLTGSLERRMRTRHGLRHQVGRRCHPRRIGLLAVSMGESSAKDLVYADLHLRTYSGNPVKSVGWSGVQAGDSLVRSRGRFRSVMTTAAQYAPLPPQTSQKKSTHKDGAGGRTLAGYPPRHL